MNQWSGKSKGTLLGYKIFVYCIKKLGIRAAYSVLVFVAFYYFIASPASFKAMYAYFKRRQQFSSFKAVWAIYKNYFVFGQTILDRVAIGAGLRNEFTFDFDGIDILKQLLSEKKRRNFNQCTYWKLRNCRKILFRNRFRISDSYCNDRSGTFGY